ncbi:Fc.00g063040.m01.CDS01 [Cosmosporella sp. VM-42]
MNMGIEHVIVKVSIADTGLWGLDAVGKSIGDPEMGCDTDDREAAAANVLLVDATRRI